MAETLYTVHAFSNEQEYTPSRGGVYIVADLTQAQVEDLKAREAEQHPDRWLKVEEQS
ncbi:hypothetical protein SCYAM73S_02475 [Streptomyces cyaneofuscatus]|uniref:hypothetical protein n=1 Tax=Streptomyces cyaneofuscatus TaxID=66883 RepID=UPI000B263955|nr:hypothetical protein [Streptomyces cyaneofuscatus]